MARLFSRHPLVLQTAFADLRRQATEQPFLLVGTPGSLGTRTVKGRDYFYRQFYDAQGKKAAEYIGGVGDPEGERKASAVRDQIDLSKDLIRQARALARQGYVRTDPRTGSILAAFVNHGLFVAGATLVGSHAFGATLNMLGVMGAAFTTEDVDLARAGALELALPEEVDFLKILRDSTIPFGPIPALGHRSPSTSYKPPGLDRLRVDLLVPAAGDEIGTKEVRELKAHATALPYLDYLLDGPVDAIVLAREGVVPVKVPRPERFAWHKMIVSRLRESISEKRAKDVAQAAVLFAVLSEDAPDELIEAARETPPRARRAARAGADGVRRLLQEGVEERALEVLEEALRIQTGNVR